MSNQPADPVEGQILFQLSQRAQGINHWGPRPSPQEQAAAAQQYVEMKAQIALRDEKATAAALEQKQLDLARSHQGHSQQVATTRVETEARKVLLDAENEARRIELEAERIQVQKALDEERLQIQKAEVVVRAIEAAAQNPNSGDLADIARAMSQHLLGSAPTPLLEGPAPLDPKLSD
jgi:hypothetical protein